MASVLPSARSSGVARTNYRVSGYSRSGALAVTQSQRLIVSYSTQLVTVQRAGFASVPALYR